MWGEEARGHGLRDVATLEGGILFPEAEIEKKKYMYLLTHFLSKMLTGMSGQSLHGATAILLQRCCRSWCDQV